MRESLRALSKVGLALLTLLLLFQLGMTLFPKNRRGDLGLVVDAAHRLWVGETLYPDSQYLPHTKSPLATLSFLPLTLLPIPVLDRLWDFMLIGLFIGLCRWALKQIPKGQGSNRAVLLYAAILTGFNPVNTEIAFGQFNLLLLTAAMVTVYCPWKRAAGFLYALSILFKPTQIVFLPWVCRFTQREEKLQQIVGAAIGVGVLLALYTFWFGAENLVRDHLVWWQKTSAVTPFHLGRPDNYGIPSFLVHASMPARFWPCLQVLAIGLVYWLCRNVHDAFRALAWTACITILFSPMAWLHVYSMSFLLVLLLWNEYFASQQLPSRTLLLGAIASYYWGTEFFNPTTEKIAAFSWMFFNRPPLIGLVGTFLLYGLWKRKIGATA